MGKWMFAIVIIFVQLIAVTLPASEIHDATAAGDMKRVRALLASDPSLMNARDTAQSLPIHLAAFRGHAAIVDLLLSKGADIDAGDRENTSPLVCAAMGNRMEVVRLLVEKGAGVNARDINGETAIISAARSRNLEMVRFLLEHSASLADTNNRGSNCLIAAASVRADSVVNFLLAKGMDINARNGRGFDALQYAILTRNTALALSLIEQGADVGYRNSQGETRLHAAAWEADTAVAAALVARGLLVDARDNFGITPLANTGWGNLPMARWLIAHGADVNAATDTTAAPLSRAVWGGNADIVRLLVSNGADINRPCRDEGSPLRSAVIRGYREIAEILLEGGADVHFTDRNYGRTMLHFAAIKGDSGMAKLLLDHGAAVEPRDQSGFTPLYYATHYANPTVMSLLAARGATLPEDIKAQPPRMLTEKMGEGEAAVWYLNHSSWAIKTANHFLIFDYFIPQLIPDRPCLANGRIDPQEIKDFDVTVFSSHGHGDHYDTTIFQWRDAIPNISYVLGHRPTGVPEYQYVAPRTDQMVDGMRVRTIRATDSGVGFLVEVDGLVIFHAGDHANGQAGLNASYTDEIDYLASLGLPIDLAFLPISGCSLGTPESVQEGNIYTLRKLSPTVFFPQHAVNGEYRFREIPGVMREQGLNVQLGCPENGGDCFRYRDHRIL